MVQIARSLVLCEFTPAGLSPRPVINTLTLVCRLKVTWYGWLIVGDNDMTNRTT